MISTLFADGAPYLLLGGTLSGVAVALGGLRYLCRAKYKADLDALETLADMLVRQAAQQFGDAMSNPEKKAYVLARLHEALPFLPSWLLETALEAAVHWMKADAQPALPVPVPAPPVMASLAFPPP